MIGSFSFTHAVGKNPSEELGEGQRNEMNRFVITLVMDSSCRKETPYSVLWTTTGDVSPDIPADGICIFLTAG